MTDSERVVEPPRPSLPEGFNPREAVDGWLQEIAPYGIFTTDAGLVVRTWNHWLVQHSGLAAETVIGRQLVEVYPDILARRLDEHFIRALQGEISVLSTALHKYLLPLPAQGAEFKLPQMLQTARIAPLPSGDRIIGTITIIEDVTQRECQAAILRRQQEYDRLLSDALALLLESDQPLEIAAELFLRIAGPLKLDAYFNYLLSADGKELHLHAAGGITPEVRRALGVLPLGEGFSGLIAVRRMPVVESRVHLSDSLHAQAARRLGLRSFAGFPLLFGDRLIGTLAFGSYERDLIAPEVVEFLSRLAQFVAIALDRAQREAALRGAEQQLRAHAEELEAKVAERTAKLHETITQLESFCYTIAHDLRAPIRSLTGFTEILLEEHAGQLPEEGQGLLRRLQRASHRLDALTRDLLKFSRIVREDVKLAPINVAELVNDILSVTPALQDGVLAVQPPLGIVLAQRTLLQQCFSNLFDNALKFSTPGQRPSIVIRSELRATATPTQLAVSTPPFNPSTAGIEIPAGPRRRIWVEDNGIGIPDEAHEKIFGIFERVPGPIPVEGTGIGLAIVARAAEQMGGSCGVESAPGAGSRFWLEFAVAEKAAEHGG